jgi:hypothetical protein
MPKELSDQIAYRATHYVERLAQRDTPSRAAKFAMIRYLALMDSVKEEAVAELEEEEKTFLFETLFPTLDFSREDVIEMLGAWARRHKDCPLGLADMLDTFRLFYKDALVDYWRENHS